MIDSRYTDYADKVLSGKILASEYVKLAARRFHSFLEREDIIFNPSKVDKVEKFIRKLKHYVGKAKGSPFILSDWEYFIIENIYGFYWKADPTKRLTRNVYIEVGRKNGKSALISGIALYALIADGEGGAEVDCIANTRQQGKILFDMASNFASSLDSKHKYLKPFRDKIKFDATKSFMQVLSSDAGTLDGFNSSLFVEDETHAAKSSALYDVLKSSQGSRENPLAICITSAGFNKYGFCYKMRETCIDILYGHKKDDSQFSVIYCLDDGDDWEDKKNWIKANPNLGITVQEDYLEGEIVQAKNNPSLETGVRTKNFGQWLNTSETWIPYDDILECTGEVRLEDHYGEIAYLGVDLSAVSDLTAVSVMIPQNDKYYFKTSYYLPESVLRDNPNSIRYLEWKNRGLLNITPGNVVDYDYILRDMIKTSEQVLIQKVAYDQYNSTQWAIDATAEGMPLEPYSQALWHFNSPTKQIERLIRQRKIVIDNNEITRWCFSNVSLKYDHNDNCKPVKTQQSNKIDGVISMIEALGVYMETPYYDNKI